jgi:hypothetical protein
MGILKDKSLESIGAAGVLIQAKCFASSIHCSYYSCLQYILDVFHEDLNISEKDLQEEYTLYVKEEKENDGDDSGRHNFYINKIGRELFKRMDKDKNTYQHMNDFTSMIHKIRRKRTDADYFRRTIGEKDSSKIKEKASNILTYLNGIDFKTDEQ